MKPAPVCLAAGASALLAAAAPVAALKGSEPPAPVRLNQIGILADGPKRAIAANPSKTSLPWRLIDSRGRVRASGQTQVFGDDSWSGEHLHRIDFGRVRGNGSGYRLQVAGAESRPFSISRNVYARLPYDALAYFYHNRAGTPIEARFVREPWARPAGHRPERATCVSGTDAKGNRWPGCAYTLDVTGGWYDAGDHGKYMVNGGISAWTLMNLYERQLHRRARSPFADGKAAVPEAGNRVNDLLDEVRWELEFFLRIQVPEGTRTSVPIRVKRNAPGLTFTDVDASGMAHHKVADVRWTSLPTAPHEDREKRQLFPPTTGATLNLAAAAAQCAGSGAGSIRLSPPAASPPPKRPMPRRGATRKSMRSPTSPAAADMATATFPTNSTGRRPSCSRPPAGRIMRRRCAPRPSSEPRLRPSSAGTESVRWARSRSPWFRTSCRAAT